MLHVDYNNGKLKMKTDWLCLHLRYTNPSCWKGLFSVLLNYNFIWHQKQEINTSHSKHC